MYHVFATPLAILYNLASIMPRIKNREHVSTPLVPIEGQNLLTDPNVRAFVGQYLLHAIEVFEREPIVSRMDNEQRVRERMNAFKTVLLDFIASADGFEIAAVQDAGAREGDSGTSISIHRRGERQDTNITLTAGTYIGQGRTFERLWVDYGRTRQVTRDASGEVLEVEPVLPSLVTRRKFVQRGREFKKEPIRPKIILPDGTDIKTNDPMVDREFDALTTVIRRTASVVARHESVA